MYFVWYIWHCPLSFSNKSKRNNIFLVYKAWHFFAFWSQSFFTVNQSKLCIQSCIDFSWTAVLFETTLNIWIDTNLSKTGLINKHWRRRVNIHLFQCTEIFLVFPVCYVLNFAKNIFILSCQTRTFLTFGGVLLVVFETIDVTSFSSLVNDVIWE